MIFNQGLFKTLVVTIQGNNQVVSINAVTIGGGWGAFGFPIPNTSISIIGAGDLKNYTLNLTGPILDNALGGGTITLTGLLTGQVNTASP